MSDYRIASRYAKSLIELAQEKGILEEVYQDILLFSKTLASSRDLGLMLRNPIVKHDKKLTVLKAIFTGKVNELTLSFFTIITEKNREAVLGSVATEFLSQYNLLKRVQKAQITTATSLTPALREEFKQLVINRTGMNTVILEEKINPGIIGGFVLRIGDIQIDDSIRTNLLRLKNQLKDNSYTSTL
ncbi:ATP synthase F1 subunit delta [Adhaeribacter radiodurans]|uniref:ATP synthase subunit delta n=1 Tax=Adhaeribacter radiodurans TaxID=2745197 RepID=A0A7L7L282_9BACT|nr:ATP synthase F1 subunit delta [Adhaeribacter radiodurans]QMU26902.1 ATP synthase F1 subunit delta [Adhaeribacter radiodurans]